MHFRCSWASNCVQPPQKVSPNWLCIDLWKLPSESLTAYISSWIHAGVKWLLFRGTYFVHKKLQFGPNISLYYCNKNSKYHISFLSLSSPLQFLSPFTLLCCSSARCWHASFDRRHCGLARHFKTDPIETVALCFGYAKTPLWRADDKADEQDISWLRLYRLANVRI
jgi:hypothetical protein